MAFYWICGFLALVWFLLVLGHWRAALAVIGAPVFIGLVIYAVFLVEAASRGQAWTVLPDWPQSTSETLKAKPGLFDDLMPAQVPDDWHRDPGAVKLVEMCKAQGKCQHLDLPQYIPDGQGGALRKSDALKPLHKPEQDRLPR
jgi:hypothetical protein